MKVDKVPGHLSREAKRIFAGLLQEYEINDIGGLRVLRIALEAFDRAQAARKQIARDGMLLVDRYGQKKAHPLLSVERDARAGFLAGLKALGLDVEPIKGTGRPPGQ